MIESDYKTQGMAMGQVGINPCVDKPHFYDPTVGENIDNQIKHLEERLASLRASREELKPLLGMKISSIRAAMNY